MPFHVPEASRVRNIGPPTLWSDDTYGNNGCFLLPSPEPGWCLFTIASDGLDDSELGGWEHVSVQATRASAPTAVGRVPTWKEMAFLKDVFWDAEDVVMQLHPRRSQYVNNHPNVLHLWRPLRDAIPEPPAILVGVRTGPPSDRARR